MNHSKMNKMAENKLELKIVQNELTSKSTVNHNQSKHQEKIGNKFKQQKNTKKQ